MAPIPEGIWGLTPFWTYHSGLMSPYEAQCRLSLTAIIVAILVFAVTGLYLITRLFIWSRMRYPEHSASVHKTEETEYPDVKKIESDGWPNFIYVCHAALSL